MSTWVYNYCSISNFPQICDKYRVNNHLEWTLAYYKNLSDTNVPKYHFDNCQDNLTITTNVAEIVEFI